MDRLSLKAEERTVTGKAVKRLRRDGLIPANVYGKKIDSESVLIRVEDFRKVFAQSGETGLIDLKIGEEKTKPVLVRDLQFDARRGELLHVDFYQVNLKQKVKVYVPVVLIGDEPESVHLGETVVLNPLSDIEIEALPADLLDKLEVDISGLKEVDDSILVSDLKIDPEKVTVITAPEEVVAKLAPAVTQEMQDLLEEQDAEAAAAVEGETEGEAADKEGESSEAESSEESSDKEESEAAN